LMDEAAFDRGFEEFGTGCRHGGVI
jgi:hypothetical protein